MFDLTLSFDNGPEPGATPGVLDILRRRGPELADFWSRELAGDPPVLVLPGDSPAGDAVRGGRRRRLGRRGSLRRRSCLRDRQGQQDRRYEHQR